MQRLIAGALLAKGTSHLHNISQSDDCTSALLLASQLGAEIELGETDVRITGTGGNIIPRSTILTPGESGLAARLFTPIAGLGTVSVSVEAENSLQGRPMHEFESIFHQLGGILKTTGGSFPVSIERPLQGRNRAPLDKQQARRLYDHVLRGSPVSPIQIGWFVPDGTLCAPTDALL